MNLYPLKLLPYQKEVIWGGNTLKRKFKIDTHIDHLGELWEMSSFKGCESIIANGEYENMTLREYLTQSGTDPDEFPLLVKFIDAEKALSVQVHPAKEEMWYVINAQRGAKLALGLAEDVTPERFAEAIREGGNKTIESCLRFVTVHPGDVFYIPEGYVHAIGAGVVVAEIQQNNDTTYRLYDYGRTDENGNQRELHIDAGLEVIRPKSDTKVFAARFARGRETERTLANSTVFCVERHTIRTMLTQSANDYTHILCIDGDGEVMGVPFRAGESILIPRGMDHYTIKANRPVTVLISKPNIRK